MKGEGERRLGDVQQWETMVDNHLQDVRFSNQMDQQVFLLFPIIVLEAVGLLRELHCCSFKAGFHPLPLSEGTFSLQPFIFAFVF